MYLRHNIEFSRCYKMIVTTKESSYIRNKKLTVSCHKLFTTLNYIVTINIPLLQGDLRVREVILQMSERFIFHPVRGQKFLSVGRTLTVWLFFSSLSSVLSCLVRLSFQRGLLSKKFLRKVSGKRKSLSSSSEF